MDMLTALNRYWKMNPPTHVLLAAFVGYKRPVQAMDAKAGQSRLPKHTPSSEPEPFEALFAKVAAMEGGSIFN